MTHARAAFLANYILSHVKSRAQYTGGKSSIEILQHDGKDLEQAEHETLELSAIHAENVGNWFIQECQRFLVLHAPNDKNEFDRLVDILGKRVQYLREVWESMIAARSGLESTKPDSSTLPPWPE